MSVYDSHDNISKWARFCNLNGTVWRRKLQTVCNGSRINMRVDGFGVPSQAGILSLISHFENGLENMLISIHTIIIIMIMQLIELLFLGVVRLFIQTQNAKHIFTYAVVYRKIQTFACMRSSFTGFDVRTYTRTHIIFIFIFKHFTTDLRICLFCSIDVESFFLYGN